METRALNATLLPSLVYRLATLMLALLDLDCSGENDNWLTSVTCVNAKDAIANSCSASHPLSVSALADNGPIHRVCRVGQSCRYISLLRIRPPVKTKVD